MNYTATQRPKGKLIEAVQDYHRAVAEVDKAAVNAIEAGVPKTEVAEVLGIRAKVLRDRMGRGRSLIEFETSKRS